MSIPPSISGWMYGTDTQALSRHYSNLYSNLSRRLSQNCNQRQQIIQIWII